MLRRKQKCAITEDSCAPKIDKEVEKYEKETPFKRSLRQFSSKFAIRKNFEKFSGLRLKDLSSFDKFTELLYQPTDPASLGVVRALFGLCMVLDIVEERGLADIDVKWGDPSECHFPLIHGAKPPSLPWIIVIYTVMWIGAFGIMLGFRFKIACACFILPYWYIFLLDKSYWNNHTYLYGVVATLFWGTEANKYFALDAYKTRETANTVPFWNYFILKFQFFALYFLAGLKKSGREWLEGYAMSNLSRHWVFNPFKLVLTSEQTDFFIVHWFTFIFDLTVGFWMLFEKTRIPAMIFCTAFHLMNSRLFSIGMFPYVCLATMPLFCNANWPRKLGSHFTKNNPIFFFRRKRKSDKQIESENRIERCEGECNSLTLSENASHTSTEIHQIHDNMANDKTNEKSSVENEKKLVNSKLKNIEKLSEPDESNKINACKEIDKFQGETLRVTKKRKFVVFLLLFHVALQFFLPYSHFITKGYNNWVPGLYGYSWDMMVHTWDTILVVIKIHDNVSNENRFLDSKAWVQNSRWEKHGDMAMQYALCIKENLIKQEEDFFKDNLKYKKKRWTRLSSNFSIYIDVWCSLNGRFQQRMFDPNADLLTVDWHPFKPLSFLMPLLTQYNSYRNKLEEIQKHVYTWSNDTDVLFVADFPGMHLDNYISTNFTNVTLTLLEGEVTYYDKKQNNGIVMTKGSSMPIRTGQFHKIKTTSTYPACYMYTYTNPDRQEPEMDRISEPKTLKDRHTFSKEIYYKVHAWFRALSHVANAFFYLVYNVPMMRRVRIDK